MFGKKKNDETELEESTSKMVYDFETDDTDFFRKPNNTEQRTREKIDNDEDVEEDENLEESTQRAGFGRIVKTFFICIILSITLFALWAFNSPMFLIEEVEINDTTSQSYEDIRRITDDLIGKNIFLEDFTTLKNNILKLSHVKKVKINRKLPSKVVVSYTERHPYMMVQRGEEYYILDKDGYILEINLVDNVYDIPLVKGIMEAEDFSGDKLSDTDIVKLKNIEYLLESIEHVEFGYDISNIEYSVDGISFLIKNSELTVKFGNVKKNQINDKLLYLKEIITQSITQGYKGTLDISSDNYNEKSVLINNY